MNTINISQGASQLLAIDGNPVLQLGIGIGWDHIAGDQNIYDLDVSVVMLEGVYLPAPEWFVYYRNMGSPDGAVRHSGDNRSGAGLGDDEWVQVYLDKIDAPITEVLFFASIHEGQMKHQHFGQVAHAYIRVYEWNSKEELVRYDLGDALRFFDTGEFGRLRRVNQNQWKFIASGKGEHGGLNTILRMYKKPGD